MKITFLGTGTSTGVPYIGCNCNVCMSKNDKDKRFRSSAIIEVDGKNILIDCGPDFRMQVLKYDVKKIDAVLLTHQHVDHIMGLDDLRPFNNVNIYADEKTDNAVHRIFSYCFNNNYPGIPTFVMNKIENKIFNVENIKIQPIEVIHGKLPIFGYRINNVAYLTDVKTIPESEFAKLNNLDVLIINALRKEEHHSHISLDEALAIIKRIKPKRAYLTHIAHSMGLHNDVEKQLPHNVYLAYDGLSITL